MKRIMLGFATVGMLALVFGAGTFAQQDKPAQEKAAQEKSSRNKVAVTITDKEGKPSKLESLSRADQARVERARKAAEKLLSEELGAGGAEERVKVTVKGSCCPLTIVITIEF